MFFDILQGLVLGGVQGLTEFFPISSSGHLVLVPALLHWKDQGLAFDTVLHLGTLAALLWFFRKDLLRLNRRLALQIIVAAVPSLLIGFFLNKFLKLYDRNVAIVALDIGFWAIILWFADVFSEKKSQQTTIEHLSWKQVVWVAVLQPLALLPGTSRSGITMTAGLFSGMSRATAARFSFLVSIPVTAAAGFYGLFELIRHPAELQSSPWSLVFGFIAALVVGAWAIRYLLAYVAHKRFTVFIVYRLILAVAVLWWLVR